MNQPKTPQEIFDRVLSHLRRQGRPAMDGESCCYMNASGSRCAVGCLIPREAYRPAMEVGGVEALQRNFPSIYNLADPTGQNLPLLRQLQLAHDYQLKVGMLPWEHQMFQIAQAHGLVYTPVEQEAVA